MKLSEEFIIFIGKLSYLLDDKLKDCVDDLQKFQNKIEKLDKYNKNIEKELAQRVEEIDRKDNEIKMYKNFYQNINNAIYMDAYDEKCCVDEKELYKLLKKDIKRILKEFREERDDPIENVFRVLPNLKKGESKVIECPICKGELYCSRSKTNGHLFIKCSTDKCITIIE